MRDSSSSPSYPPVENKKPEFSLSGVSHKPGSIIDNETVSILNVILANIETLLKETPLSIKCYDDKV